MNGGKANNIIRIPSSLDTTFFKYWFAFLKPIHKLTDREIDVLALFVKERFYLSKKINDEDLINKVLMNEDTKRKIREECNMTVSYFQLIMSKLRQAKVIVDNKINPKFIPNIKEDSNSFQLLLYFDLK